REAGDLGVHLGAAPPGVAQFLQDQDGRTLAEHEPIAAAVVRAKRVLGVVVVVGGGPDRVEAGNGDRRDGRLGGTGDDHVGRAVEDQLAGVAEGVDPGGAAVGDQRYRALRAD